VFIRNVVIGGEIRVILNCFYKFSQGQQVVCLKSTVEYNKKTNYRLFKVRIQMKLYEHHRYFHD